MSYPTRPELEIIRTTHRFKTKEELQAEYGEEYRMRTPGFHSSLDVYLGKTIGKVAIKETSSGVRLQVKAGSNVSMEMLIEKEGKKPETEKVKEIKPTKPKKEVVIEKSEKPQIEEGCIYSQAYDVAIKKYIKDELIREKVASAVQNIDLSTSDNRARMRIMDAAGNYTFDICYTYGSSGTQTCCGYKEFGPFGFYNGSSLYDRDSVAGKMFNLLLELGVRDFVKRNYNGNDNNKKNSRHGAFATILPDVKGYHPIKAVFESVDFMLHCDTFKNSNTGRTIEMWCFSYGDMFLEKK